MKLTLGVNNWSEEAEVGAFRLTLIWRRRQNSDHLAGRAPTDSESAGYDQNSTVSIGALIKKMNNKVIILQRETEWERREGETEWREESRGGREGRGAGEGRERGREREVERVRGKGSRRERRNKPIVINFGWLLATWYLLLSLTVCGENFEKTFISIYYSPSPSTLYLFRYKLTD